MLLTKFTCDEAAIIHYRRKDWKISKGKALVGDGSPVLRPERAFFLHGQEEAFRPSFRHSVRAVQGGPGK